MQPKACCSGPIAAPQVVSGHLRSLCSLCSGSLINTQPAGPFRKQLVVFRNIARYHSFELLGEVAGGILKAADGIAGCWGA